MVSGHYQNTGSFIIPLLTLFKIFIPDMRKAMSRDKDKKSMIPLKHPVHCEEEF